MGTNRYGSALEPNPELQALSAIGVIELLEQDGRPTFILDLEDNANSADKHLHLAFCNASLRSFTMLRDVVLGKADLAEELGLHQWTTHSEFKKWAMGFNSHDILKDGSLPTFTHGGILWTCSTLRKRWRLVSANQVGQMGGVMTGSLVTHPSTPVTTTTVQRESSSGQDIPKRTQVKRTSARNPKPPNWIELLPSTDHVEFFKDTDWSSSALGPLESWSPELRQMTTFLMVDSRPAAVFWGPQKVTIYNEAYKPMASEKHPKLMGSTFKQAWPEVYDKFSFIFANAQLMGQAPSMEHSCFFVERHGYLEEAFFSWTMIPLRGPSGDVEGFYNPVFETTRQKISDRRTKTLLSMAVAPNMQSFWRDILQGLAPNELDIPFALLYSLSKDLETENSSETCLCNLEGTLGIPKGHVSAPNRVNFENSTEGFIPLFRKAMASSNPLVLHKRDGSLPGALTQGFQWRGFGESSTAVIFPLVAGDKVLGFLLTGLNPRRSYDTDYQQFIELLSRQLSTSMTSAVLIEQAAVRRAKLSKQLAMRTREAEESQKRFARIAELMPVGFLSCDCDGKLLFCNNAFFEITAHPSNADTAVSWTNTIVDEDIPRFRKLWHTMTVDQQSMNFQIRLKKKFQASKNPRGEIVEYYTTVLVNAYPDLDEDGLTKGVTGCLTDISPLKHLEEMRERRAEEALERATLSEQLAIRTQQAVDSESKFKALAELTPIGMFYASAAGEIIYANAAWFEITAHDKGLQSEMSFMSVILEDDQSLMEKEWINLTMAQVKRTFELRLKKRWSDKTSGKSSPTWILVSASQEKNEDGSTKSVMGCITDISLQKQAQADALERAALSEQLIIRTQEAAESEKKFKQMAELAPCGMFYILPDGMVTWANSQWYEMTGHGRSPEAHYPMSFLDFIAEEDLPLLHQEWEKLTVVKIEVTFEVRVRKPWINKTSGKSSKETAWLLAMAFPLKNKDGSVKSIMGCTADISQFKWAESVQTRSRLEAEEAKRQQEQFMDITSHEMRNPLSAILQCADGITTSITDYQSAVDKPAIVSEELVQSIYDAAHIITLCTQHQTRIINDVLTLSKLDSAMLMVTPIVVQPTAVVKEILKMFEGELQSQDIEMHFRLEPSYNDTQIDWVFCDPSRLRQVFINILTNAIKFTRSEAERKITVSLGASVDKPPKGQEPNLKWFASKSVESKKDPTLDSDWGEGQGVFLYFAVKDTGRGLSAEEETRLFHRFSQASPRTHVQYGGSGLGLFISRELTELQGGEIGVASEAGKGSTFAFFIKGRRADAPVDKATKIGIRTESDPSKDLQTKPSKSAAVPAHPPIANEMQSDERVNKYVVLLVEDNLVNQKVLGKQLRKAGCTVHVANHGQEALDFLHLTKLWKDIDRGEDLDIILMDLEMPVMDGLTCTRKIRELQRQGSIRQHLPVIAVTANARTEQINIAMAAGVDDVMPKPFRVSDLISKMGKLKAKQ